MKFSRLTTNFHTSAYLYQKYEKTLYGEFTELLCLYLSSSKKKKKKKKNKQHLLQLQ